MFMLESFPVARQAGKGSSFSNKEELCWKKLWVIQATMSATKKAAEA